MPDGLTARRLIACDCVPHQNPCLMALRLAGSCEAATRRFVNDRLRVARLREAELIFEFVASGLLHVAARDAIHAEAAKGYDLTRSDGNCPLIVMIIAL